MRIYVEILKNWHERKKTMNFILLRRFIVGAILLLLISDVNGAYDRRRRQINNGGKNDLDWQEILNNIRKIPLVGAGLSKGLQDLAKTVHQVDELTNGALSRIAGGYPPCVIDLQGIHCNGEEKNGGIRGIAADLINGTALPSMAKIMIIDFLNAAVFPLFDGVVGVRVTSDKRT